MKLPQQSKQGAVHNVDVLVGGMWYNVGMAKASYLVLALVAAAAMLPADAALKGIVLWPDLARKRPDLSSAISLEYSYALPCDIVSGTNSTGALVCDWRGFDSLLDDIASRGHQAIIRFRYAYPGEKLGGTHGATAVPAFVKAAPGYKETFAANPGGDGPTYYPDWSCPALEEFTLAFYRELARRYDADPRLAFVQAGFGHWAEYHTSGTKTRLGRNFPSLDFQRRFLALLSKSFVETPWMISIDAADGKRSPAAALAAEGMAFGLFDDSFMCEEHEIDGKDGGWNERNWRAFGADHWKRAPHGGEISYYSRRDQREFLGPKGIYGRTWAQSAAKYHMTFVIANDSPDGQFATPERFREAARECGPELVATAVQERPDGVAVTVANKGVAPPCHDLALSVGGKTAAGTLKGLLPGESRVLVAKGARPDGALMLVSKKLLSPIPLPRGE